jgi:hypothetical protein
MALPLGTAVIVNNTATNAAEVQTALQAPLGNVHACQRIAGKHMLHIPAAKQT